LLLVVGVVTNLFLGAGSFFAVFAYAGLTPGAIYGEHRVFAVFLLSTSVLCYFNSVVLLNLLFDRQRRAPLITYATNLILLVFAVLVSVFGLPYRLLPCPEAIALGSVAVVSCGAIWLKLALLPMAVSGLSSRESQNSETASR